MEKNVDQERTEFPLSMNSSVINGSDISKHEPVVDAVKKDEHDSKINSISDVTNIDQNVSFL